MDINFMGWQGMSISQIARESGHTRKAVRRHLKSGDITYYKKGKPCPAVLDPYKDTLMSLFRSGVQNGVVLYEKISEMGYLGSYESVKKFLTPLRQESRRQETTVRFESDPGEAWDA